MARRIRHKKRKEPSLKASLRVERLGAGGDGVADYQGKSVYVPYTVPGDQIETTISGARGVCDGIVEASADRVSPPCSHFGSCGGCAVQHISEKLYKRWKRDLVITALEQAGFDGSVVRPIVSCPPQTRRRISFAVRRTSDGVLFGFHEKRSIRIEPVETCFIAHPELQAALPKLKTLALALCQQWLQFTMLVVLCDNGIDVGITGDVSIDDVSGQDLIALTHAAAQSGVLRLTVGDTPVIAHASADITFGDLVVQLPPGAFLQSSHEGEVALQNLVGEAADGAKKIADLFCGVGTFTGELMQAASVDAFDSDKQAIAALDGGLRRLKSPHRARAITRNLFLSPLLAKELKAYDVVVLDPPRAGAQAQTREVAQSGVKRVIAVSCNPGTFARDSAILREGGYQLLSVTPVDQFVYAAHIELVGVFVR